MRVVDTPILSELMRPDPTPRLWAYRQAQSQNTGNLQVCPMRTRVKRRYQRCIEHQGVGDWRNWTRGGGG